MDNKEIFALATHTAKALKAANLTNHIPKAKQAIYEAIAPTLQKTVKTSIEIKTTDKENTAKNNGEKKEGLEPPLLPDDATLRARLKLHLIEKLGNGTLQAAEIAQLKDVFGLADHESDLSIELVNYAETIVNCPSCGENVYRPKTPDN